MSERYEVIGGGSLVGGSKMEAQKATLEREEKIERGGDADEGIGGSTFLENGDTGFGSKLDDSSGDCFTEEVQVTSTPMNQAAGNPNREDRTNISTDILQTILKAMDDQKRDMMKTLDSKIGELSGQIMTEQKAAAKAIEEKIEKSAEQGKKTEQKIEELNGKIEEQDRRAEERYNKLRDEIRGQVESLDQRVEITKNEVSKLAKRVEAQDQWILEKFSEQKGELKSQISQISGELETQLHHQVNSQIAVQDKKIQGVQGQFREEIRTVESKMADIQTQVKNEVHRREEDTRTIQQSIKEEIKGNIRICEEKVSSLQSDVELIKECRIMPIITGGIPTFTPPKSLKFSGDGRVNPCAFMRAAERHLAVINTSERCKVQFLYLMLDGNARTWADTFDAFPETLKEFQDRFYERYWNDEIQMNVKLNLMNGYYNQSMGTMREYATQRVGDCKTLRPPMNDQEIICLLTRQFPVSIQNNLRSANHTNLESFMNALGGYDLTFANAPKNKREGNVNTLSMEPASRQGNGGGADNQWIRHETGSRGQSEQNNQRPQWRGQDPNRREEERGTNQGTPNQSARPGPRGGQGTSLNR